MLYAHLFDLCRNAIHDSKIASKLKMHHTKYSGIIKNVLSTHFKNDPINDIRNGKFSLLLDKSNDITVLKMLGISIVCFSKKYNKVIYMHFSIIKLDKYDADSIVKTLKNKLMRKKLNIMKLAAIETDNASVMVGVNNGVYKRLKQKIFHLF